MSKSKNTEPADLRSRVRAVTKRLGATAAAKAFHLNRGTLERYLAAVDTKMRAGTIACLTTYLEEAEKMK